MFLANLLDHLGLLLAKWLEARLNARDAWAPSLFDGDASLCAGLVISGHEKVLTGNMTAAVGSV